VAQTLKERLSSPFNLATVKHLYGAGVDYIGPIMHPKFDRLAYVFYQPQPKRELGHTEFFAFVSMPSDANRWYIIGLVGEEVEAYQWHQAVECAKCEDVITSLNVHDYRTCSCGYAMIDGGSSYLRMNVGSNLKRLNTITGELA
jgi:hypothetical protein